MGTKAVKNRLDHGCTGELGRFDHGTLEQLDLIQDAGSTPIEFNEEMVAQHLKGPGIGRLRFRLISIHLPKKPIADCVRTMA